MVVITILASCLIAFLAFGGMKAFEQKKLETALEDVLCDAGHLQEAIWKGFKSGELNKEQIEMCRNLLTTTRNRTNALILLYKKENLTDRHKELIDRLDSNYELMLETLK